MKRFVTLHHAQRVLPACRQPCISTLYSSHQACLTNPHRLLLQNSPTDWRYCGTMRKKVKGAKGRVVLAGKHPNSAVGEPESKQGQRDAEKGTATFRFWHDERRFKGSGERCIVQKALFDAGGVRTGGYPKAAPIPGPLGYQRPTDWDLLWTPARMAMKAVPQVKPGQLISCFPGVMSLTRKRKLSVTLKEGLGDASFQLMPRTFTLPDELADWEQWVQQEQQQQRQVLWILKTAQHLGKGLRLLPATEALIEVAKPRSKARGEKPFVAAQEYVANPLLIDGRKFGIRVWVLVTGHNPLRVYMHSNGLVLFSTHSYNTDSWSTNEGDVALGHVTNYAQNMDGTVWSLAQLQQHLGLSAFDQLWGNIAKSSAAVFAASLKHIKEAHETLRIPNGSTFELLGLDFLVDESLYPWLLEVNGTPSLAVDHEDPAVEATIYTQKMGMVQDMVKLLNCRDRFKPRYAVMKLASQTSKGLPLEEDDNEVTASSPVVMTRKLREQLSPTLDDAVRASVLSELQNAGGWLPLMPLFPIAGNQHAAAPSEAAPGAAAAPEAAAGMVSIPWDRRDYELHALLKDCAVKPIAVA